MLLGVTDIVILLYRTTHPRIYLRITKTVTCKNYSFIGAISFGGCVIWCIAGLLVSRFALHFWVVVVE